MLSRTRYAYSGRCRRLYSSPECAIRPREDRKAGSGGCLGGRQADKQTDCGCRFRLEKHPEQSKPVSVGSSGGGGRARRDKIFGSRARLSGRLRGCVVG